MEEQRKIEILGYYGALLTAFEVGLGSFLHSLHIPFAGIFLSLNQGYLLCRGTLASREMTGTHWMSYSISNIAAVLKSLSPAGPKLGPMLSLSMQGLLFNLGTITFGVNILGLSLGMALLSVWSFIQPLITYYLFFGEKLFKSLEYAYTKTLPYHQLSIDDMKWIFGGLIVFKALVGIGLAIVAVRTNGKAFFQDQLMALAKNKGLRSEGRSAVLFALKDLLRPIFLLSLLMTGLFLWYSQHELGQIGWYLLRPMAIGFVFFYFSRTLTLDRWLEHLEGGHLEGLAKGCREALRQIRKIL